MMSNSSQGPQPNRSRSTSLSSSSSSTTLLATAIAPSKLRLALYKLSSGLAWGSIITESCFFSRFMYSSVLASLNTLPQIFFGFSLPLIATKIFAGVITTGDVITNVSAVNPRADALEFFGLEKLNARFILMDDVINYTPSLTGYRKSLDLIFRKGLISLFIAFQCLMGGITNWLPYYRDLEDMPWLNYSLGITVTLIGANYIMLFLARLIQNTYASLRNIQASTVGYLFKLSLFDFTLPMTRLLIAIAFNVATYTFFAKTAAEIIFGLTSASAQLVVQIVTAIAITFTTFGSRLNRVSQPYLQPYRRSGNAYDLSLVNAEMRNTAWSELGNKERFFLRMKSSPLALIRGLSFSYLTNILLHGKMEKDSSSSILEGFISALVGSLMFLHAYSIEHKKELSLLIRSRSHNINYRNEPQINRIPQFIAALCNLSLQLARGLLAIYAHVDILGPYIGAEKSAAIGLAVALEISWVTFWLYQTPTSKNIEKLGSFFSNVTLFSNRYTQRQQHSAIPRLEIEMPSNIDRFELLTAAPDTSRSSSQRSSSSM